MLASAVFRVLSGTAVREKEETPVFSEKEINLSLVATPVGPSE